MIVAAGGLLGCVAIGAMFSLPVLLRPISRGYRLVGDRRIDRHDHRFPRVGLRQHDLGWPVRPFWAKGGRHRRVGDAVPQALRSASQATSLIQFQIVFGLIVGAATAAIFAPMMACVTGWFETQRSLAVSLVSAGMGMAPMTMAPLVAWLVSVYDWRTTLLIVAAIAAVIMIPAAFLVRSPPALSSSNAVASARCRSHSPKCRWGRRSGRRSSSSCC